MTLSCAGTVIVSRTMTNSVFLPGNDSFAKANPAIAQRTAEIAAIDSDTMTLLIRDWMKGTVSNTFVAMSQKFNPGYRRGGLEVTAVAPTDAITNM